MILAGRAQEVYPAVRLVPADIVQESLKTVRWTTNSYAVKWRYTETGAKKVLAFWGRHEGQKVCFQVGAYITPAFVAPASIDPLTHSDWRESWLKRRTDQLLNLGENDVTTVVAALKDG